jgi:ribosomal 50S subunit-recycling heat shock protein
MRLDMFLKSSRLVPRRSLAQEFCDARLIEVNGLTAKPSKEIGPGDKITIRRRSRITTVEVAALPAGKQVAKNAVAELYRMISDETLSVDPLA